MQKLDKQAIIEVFMPYQPRRICIFGSFARGEAEEKSDVDILYDFKGPMTFIELSQLKTALEDKLKRKVDLISEKYCKMKVEKELIYES